MEVTGEEGAHQGAQYLNKNIVTLLAGLKASGFK